MTLRVNKAEVAAERLRDEERLAGLARVREANRLHLPRWKRLWGVGFHDMDDKLFTLLPLSTGGISRFPSEAAAGLVAEQLRPLGRWKPVRLPFAVRWWDNIAAAWRFLFKRRRDVA